MTSGSFGGPDVDAFISRDIDSVPHLEALLFLWNQRSQNHTAEELARYLFIDEDRAGVILQDLQNLNLLAIGMRRGLRSATR